ncbi:hypothetical protein A1Q1_04126 [Trichosporon asahii var. asahii CBS 2479]|uniref:Uncharacterized protein n=1 Tax=Trichosporon asahii var. asahii (strain ATCC 90039 / CBS 2479 / JCM 2466 / KCTC 7840 / NBRC 103889/ NCYC 2677 / UAMH 7654) TaxID=1186058 RepID=J5QFU1_TRIAS|nr:hypothetical protein A1Q1_04126 [Trichosporon asahii var. asahii CBS 2479]EJT47133.1 hypothetical protein A1Q1_04126 [Trichosporon asahii var. asahii CBS 2479]
MGFFWRRNKRQNSQPKIAHIEHIRPDGKALPDTPAPQYVPYSQRPPGAGVASTASTPSSSSRSTPPNEYTEYMSRPPQGASSSPQNRSPLSSPSYGSPGHGGGRGWRRARAEPQPEPLAEQLDRPRPRVPAHAERDARGRAQPGLVHDPRRGDLLGTGTPGVHGHGAAAGHHEPRRHAQEELLEERPVIRRGEVETPYTPPIRNHSTDTEHEAHPSIHHHFCHPPIHHCLS